MRSLIAAPLRRDGRVSGTLAIYDKVSADRFTTGSFGEEDLQLFTKFVSYLERAIANALFYAHARRFRNFDEETGLPNAAYLEKRIQEENGDAPGRSFPGLMSKKRPGTVITLCSRARRKKASPSHSGAFKPARLAHT